MMVSGEKDISRREVVVRSRRKGSMRGVEWRSQSVGMWSRSRSWRILSRNVASAAAAWVCVRVLVSRSATGYVRLLFMFWDGSVR